MEFLNSARIDRKRKRGRFEQMVVRFDSVRRWRNFWWKVAFPFGSVLGLDFCENSIHSEHDSTLTLTQSLLLSFISSKTKFHWICSFSEFFAKFYQVHNVNYAFHVMYINFPFLMLLMFTGGIFDNSVHNYANSFCIVVYSTFYHAAGAINKNVIDIWTVRAIANIFTLFVFIMHIIARTCIQ